MVTLDGYIISHTTEGVELLEDEKVKAFVGEYKPDRTLLDVDHPYTMGPLDLPDYYFEHKRGQVEAMENARRVIGRIAEEFENLAGRRYGFFEEYRLQDAEVALVALGSAAGTAKAAVDAAREEGVKAGILKLRVFRPFPGNEIARALAHVPVVGVMDRSISFGLQGGPVFNEIRSFAYGQKNQFYGYIYGLGGRDINVNEMLHAIRELSEARKTGGKKELVGYIGLRE
jgi:pyruvate ferredoxin oxidoreductase alpha subunit